MQNGNEKQQQSGGSITIWLLDSLLAFSPTALSCPPGPGHSGLLPSSQTWHTYSWPQANVCVLPSSAIFIWLTLINPTSSHRDAASLGYFFTPAKATSSGSPQHVEPPLLPVESHVPLFAPGRVLCKTINALTGTMSIGFTTKSSDWYMVGMQEVFAELTLRRR